MHRQDVGGSRLFVPRDGDEILVADDQKEQSKNGQSESGLEPGEPADSSGGEDGPRSGRASENFPGGGNKFGGRAQLGGAFGARKVVLFVSIALDRREFAQQVSLAGLRSKRFVVVHRRSFH